MALNSQRVWDYIGDNYVHRMVQDSKNGTVMYVDYPHSDLDRGRRGPGPLNEQQRSSEQEEVNEQKQQKMDELGVEVRYVSFNFPIIEGKGSLVPCSTI